MEGSGTDWKGGIEGGPWPAGNSLYRGTSTGGNTATSRDNAMNIG